tara:strand:+ start:473 stop:700 length:228 start_codon:yes stop_codon:yes gene_type:complete
MSELNSYKRTRLSTTKGEIRDRSPLARGSGSGSGWEESECARSVEDDAVRSSGDSSPAFGEGAEVQNLIEIKKEV